MYGLTPVSQLVRCSVPGGGPVGLAQPGPDCPVSPAPVLQAALHTSLLAPGGKWNKLSRQYMYQNLNPSWILIFRSQRLDSIPQLHIYPYRDGTLTT